MNVALMTDKPPWTVNHDLSVIGDHAYHLEWHQVAAGRPMAAATALALQGGAPTADTAPALPGIPTAARQYDCHPLVCSAQRIQGHWHQPQGRCQLPQGGQWWSSCCEAPPSGQ